MSSCLSLSMHAQDIQRFTKMGHEVPRDSAQNSKESCLAEIISGIKQSGIPQATHICAGDSLACKPDSLQRNLHQSLSTCLSTSSLQK